MFTGIVEELGAVRSFDGDRLRITCTTVAADAGIGDSIAVNGICLTVVDLGDGGLAFDVSPETRRRTSVRDLVAGDVVNLERPLAFGARLGGHLVQGHVDGVAAVRSVTPAAAAISRTVVASYPCSVNLARAAASRLARVLLLWISRRPGVVMTLVRPKVSWLT